MDRFRRLSLIESRGKRTLLGYVVRVSQENALTCIRNWAHVLADRGKVQIGLSDVDNYIELRKRCWKKRPHLLMFRYRNSDITRKHFAAVKQRFDSAGIEYDMALTRKKQRPRAIEIPFDPYDVHTPRAILNLASHAFGAEVENMQHFDLSCQGTIRSDVEEQSLEVYIPPEAYEASLGYRIGYSVGSAVRRGLSILGGVDVRR